MTSHVLEAPLDSSLLESIRTDIKADAFAQGILDHIVEKRASCSRSTNDRKDYHLFTWYDGLLFRSNQLYIPDGSCRLQVLQHCHDSAMVGHYGVHKTLELVTRNYWWPDLRIYIEDYIRTCDICCRSKIPRHHPYGLLQPLPIPEGPWKSISLDFITDLPSSKGFDAILIVVDRWPIFFHARKPYVGERQPTSFYEKYSDYIVCLMI